MSPYARWMDTSRARDFDPDTWLHDGEADRHRRFIDLVWPGCAYRRGSSDEDRLGVDWYVDGVGNLDVKMVTRELFQRDAPPMVPLEVYSNAVLQTPGWTLDGRKLTDWAVWLWLTSDRFVVAHAPTLRTWFRDPAVQGRYPTVARQHHQTHCTGLAAFVPVQDILAGVGPANISWGHLPTR